MIKVLFVCLGNICRSTMAEAVLRHLAAEAGLAGIAADSAGTGNYHTGDPPHKGTRKELERHGISWQGIRARTIDPGDLEDFDYIVAMDEDNLQNLRALANEAQGEKLHLLSDFLPDSGWRSVPDPWFTGDFAETYRLVHAGCQALLEELEGKLQ